MTEMKTLEEEIEETYERRLKEFSLYLECLTDDELNVGSSLARSSENCILAMADGIKIKRARRIKEYLKNGKEDGRICSDREKDCNDN